jgi:hypothetical protein
MKTKILKFAYRVMVASLLIMMFVGCEKEEEVKPLLHSYEISVKGYYIGDLVVIAGKHYQRFENYSGGGIDWRNNYGVYKPSFYAKIDTVSASIPLYLKVSDGGGENKERVRILVKKDGIVKIDTTFDYLKNVKMIVINQKI